MLATARQIICNIYLRISYIWYIFVRNLKLLVMIIEDIVKVDGMNIHIVCENGDSKEVRKQRARRKLYNYCSGKIKSLR